MTVVVIIKIYNALAAANKTKIKFIKQKEIFNYGMQKCLQNKKHYY